MKTSVIKKHILEGLAPYVKEYGFKILKSQFEIARKDRNKYFRWVFINERPLWEDEKHYRLVLWGDFKKILEVSDVIKPKNGGKFVNFCTHMNLLAFKSYVDGKAELTNMRHFFYPNPSSLILLDGAVFHSVKKFKQDKELPLAAPVFIIEDEDSFKPVVEYLRTLLPYVAKYFEWMGSIEAIDKFYNRLPIRYNPNVKWAGNHASIGLIAAKLTNNPDYEILKKAYLQYLYDIKYSNEEQIEDIKLLIEYLDTHDVSCK